MFSWIKNIFSTISKDSHYELIRKMLLANLGFLLENNQDKCDELLKFFIGMQALISRGYDLTDEFLKHEFEKVLLVLGVDHDIILHFLDLVDIGLELLKIDEDRDYLIDLFKDAENLIKRYKKK